MQISILDLLQATSVGVPVQAKAAKADTSAADAFAMLFAQMRGALPEMATAVPLVTTETSEEAIEAEEVEGTETDEEVSAGDVANTVVGFGMTVDEAAVETGDASVSVTQGETKSPVLLFSLRSTRVSEGAGSDMKTVAEAVSTLTSVAGDEALMAKSTGTNDVAAAIVAKSSTGSEASASQPPSPTPSTEVLQQTMATVPVLPVLPKAVKAGTGGDVSPDLTGSDAETAKKVLSLAKAKVEHSKAVPHKNEATSEVSAKADFPADLRVAHIVRQVNPELVANLNRPLAREVVSTVHPAEAGPETGSTPSMGAPSPATERAEHVKATPIVVTTERVSLSDVGETVIRQVKMGGVQQDRTLTIKLVPESLGEIRLEIKTSGGQTSVHLVSANATVRDALESQVHLLREALGREGVDLHSVQVTNTLPPANTAHSGGHETPGQHQPQWSHARHSGAGTQHRNGGETLQPGGQPSETPERHSPADGSLNLFV